MDAAGDLRLTSRLIADDGTFECLSVLEVADPCLMVRSRVAELELEVHTSFTPFAPDGLTGAYVIVQDGVEPAVVSHDTTGSARCADDRRRLLLEHLAYVRDTVAERLDGAVSLEAPEVWRDPTD